jgi:hypothetical protein
MIVPRILSRSQHPNNYASSLIEEADLAHANANKSRVFFPAIAEYSQNVAIFMSALHFAQRRHPTLV